MPTYIEQPPTPSILLASLRNTGYTLKSAIADVIDNSITAQAQHISVQSRYPIAQGSPWIAVCDNGEGMDRDLLCSSMKFGSRDLEAARRGTRDLGRFGLGMKTASISQCRRMTVFSWQSGVCSAFSWDLDQISVQWDMQELDNAEIESHPALHEILECLRFDVQEHGTVVLWEKLDRDYVKNSRNFNTAMEMVEKHLCQVFHRFMEPEPGFPDIVHFDRNNRVLYPVSPFGRDLPGCQRLPGDRIPCGDFHVEYRPYLLPPAVCYTRTEDYRALGGDEGYMLNQGFYVYRNRRLIEKATWFKVRKKEFKTQLLRIRLDMPAELDGMWSVDVRKSQTSPPSEVMDVLSHIVDSALEAARQFWDGGQRTRHPAERPKESAWIVPGDNKSGGYRVNKEHELYKMLLKALPRPELRKVFSEYMDMISELFPYDLYYADRSQNEGAWQGSESDTNTRLANLINNLVEAGLDENAVRHMLCCFETGFPDGLVKQYLNIKYNGHV